LGLFSDLMNSASGSKPFLWQSLPVSVFWSVGKVEVFKFGFLEQSDFTFSSSVSFLVRVPHLECPFFEFAQVGKSVRQVAQLDFIHLLSALLR